MNSVQALVYKAAHVWLYALSDTVQIYSKVVVRDVLPP
jgi:hypothetical protein